MEKGIGEIISRLRKCAGFSQEQLCEGICTVSEMAKIEMNQRVPGHFQLDRLFERMGKTTERLEYVLSGEVYELYELKYKIQTAICRKRFDEAERLLEKYEKKKKADQPLHQQFSGQERAQIAWLRGESTETVLRFLNAAIVQTIKPEGALAGNSALSAEEIKLLLFRWEVSRGTIYERPLEEVYEALRYVETHTFDQVEKVRVYPYIVLLLAEELDWKKEYDRLSYLAKISLELLRDTGKILYMPETLEMYSGLLKYREKEPEHAEELLSWRKSLLALEEEFEIDLKKYRLFHHLNRSFELDYELIRQERKAVGLTQAELASEICEPESLSRIENGKRRPTNQNLESLLGKIERKRTRINPIITTEEYEVLELERELVQKESRKEGYEYRKELLRKMENRLDMDIVQNKQYIELVKVKMRVWDKKLPYQKEIEELYQILWMTLDKKQDVFAHRLTFVEVNILNFIACRFSENQEEEKAISIWEKIIENYKESCIHPAYRIRDWELILGNLAGTMEELNIFDKTLELCKQRLEIELTVGKGNEIGRGAAIIACVLERKHDEKCISRFRQTLDIMKLMKMDYRYRCIREYVEQKGLWEKVRMCY